MTIDAFPTPLTAAQVLAKLNANAPIALSSAVSITSTTASSSTTTGALVVSGGVGVAGNVYAGGLFRATGTGAVFQSSGATTAQRYMNIANTGADFYFGVEASAAGTWFTGSEAYDAACYAGGKLYLAGFGGVKLNPGSGNDVAISSGGHLKLGNAAVAATPTATHTITIKDSTGTTYRVLCVV